MKELITGILMCIAALTAKAQVLTSETIKNVHNEMTSKANSEYVYNVDYTGNDITTMYVYKKEYAENDVLLLKSYLKYDYTYAEDGILTNKVAYRWDDLLNSWACTACYDYAVADGKYMIEYSRYNATANCFEQPVDRMVYSLIPFSGVNTVSSYHREDATSPFELIYEMEVMDEPVLYAEQHK